MFFHLSSALSSSKWIEPKLNMFKIKNKKERIHKHCIKEERGPWGCGSHCQGEREAWCE